MLKFEDLGAANNWDDAVVAAIYLSLIDDERTKEKLCNNSYKKLKKTAESNCPFTKWNKIITYKAWSYKAVV